jgi:hypothetical protein
LGEDADGDRVDRYEVANATPEEFERLVVEIFDSIRPRVDQLKVTHQERLSGTDGEFVIDATARFEAFGVEFLVLIEAKLHGRSIERADVQVLRDKLLSTGAQKGILASNAGFQKGAIDYAQVHGIALARIVHRDADAIEQIRAGRRRQRGNVARGREKVRETRRRDDVSHGNSRRSNRPNPSTASGGSFHVR